MGAFSFNITYDWERKQRSAGRRKGALESDKRLPILTSSFGITVAIELFMVHERAGSLKLVHKSGDGPMHRGQVLGTGN